MKTFLICFAFACCLVLRWLVAPSTVAPQTTCTVTGTNNAQGTGTSTQSALTTTLTSSATGTVLAYGTGSNQVNLIISQDRALALSTGETLDLYGHTTPLADIFGSSCLFLHIKYILIYILPGTGDISGLTIGNAASNPFVGAFAGTTPTLTIYPGGPPYQQGEPTAGFVCSATHGQLLITNNSSAVACNYRIVVAGTTT